MDDIKMDLKEIQCQVVDWIQLAQDKFQWRTLVSMVMNPWGPRNQGFIEWLSDYQLLNKTLLNAVMHKNKGVRVRTMFCCKSQRVVTVTENGGRLFIGANEMFTLAFNIERNFIK
jgi:hypothetical protein